MGPAFDELKPEAAVVARTVRQGLGSMPAFSALSEAEIQAVARYVEWASRRPAK